MYIGTVQQKGGVGKTTVTINVAGALSELGYEVLLVDMDPQGYLTSGVGLSDEYAAEPPSMANALMSPSEYDMAELVVEHAEFDVVPANVDMFSLPQNLYGAMRGRERLGMLLDDVAGYDVVMVDAPPSLGILTDNVLLATQHALIPAQAEDTSIRALELLSNQIDTLEDNYNTRIRELAIVASAVEYPLDGEQQGMLEWFEKTFAGIPMHEIRKRAAIKRAYNAGVSIFSHDEDCDQEEPLLALARDLMSSEVAQ